MKTLNQADAISAREEIPNRKHIQAAEKVHLLSIGAMDRSYVLHDTLLEAQNLHSLMALESHEMWLIPDYRQLWVIPRQETVHLAILHETLSYLELDEACRFIRHQWPSARILVIRAGEGFLEDALYDERVKPGSSPALLLSAIQRLLERRCE